MFQEKELKAEMARKGINKKQLAKEIGMSTKTLYLKMKTGKFGIDEVEKIMRVLDLKSPMSIFFAGW